MIILLHSSKTMRRDIRRTTKPTTPQFIDQANEIASCVKSMSVKEIERVMKISPKLAVVTRELMKSWTTRPSDQTPAIDSFLGDIYSGLQAENLNARDRQFAQKHLRILSGLYGILKPLDGISPYRLEMAYKLPSKKFSNLYKYWGDSLAATIQDEPIINVSSAEYTKALLPYVGSVDVVTPKFLSVDLRTKQPKFVVVHAKIARGAFAHWAIKNRIKDVRDVVNFAEIGYRHNKKLSSPLEPVFVAKEFQGTGLSVRLS